MHTCRDIWCSARAQQFCVLEAFDLGSMCSIFLFLGIEVGLGGGYYQQIYVFNQDLDGFVAEIHPMHGEGKFSEMT
jgi:hypothetical protein